MKLAPGPTRFAIQRITENPVSAMKIFLTDDTLKLILEETNREMKRIRLEKNKNYILVSAEELEAYIGMYFYMNFYFFLKNGCIVPE